MANAPPPKWCMVVILTATSKMAQLNGSAFALTKECRPPRGVTWLESRARHGTHQRAYGQHGKLKRSLRGPNPILLAKDQLVFEGDNDEILMSSPITR